MGKALDAALAEGDIRRQREHDRELAKWRRKCEELERRYKQAESDLAQVQDYAELKDTLDKCDPRGYERKPRKVHGAATAIIVLSDWHVEEPVDPRTCNGKNEFNLEIADKRITTTLQKAVELLEVERKSSNIKDLVVALLGDFITGYIHEELEEVNTLSPIEACHWVQDRILGGIDFLRKESGCKSITIPTARGNHGRSTKKLRFSSGWKNSFEQGLYWSMERYYRNVPSVAWKVENGYANYLEVQGKLIRFHHGEVFRYKGGIQGPGVPIMRWIANEDKTTTAWLDVFGHLHTRIVGDNDKFICNPSLIGYGAAAPYFSGRFAPPMQTLIVVDKNRRIPTAVKPIFCD